MEEPQRRRRDTLISSLCGVTGLEASRLYIGFLYLGGVLGGVYSLRGRYGEVVKGVSVRPEGSGSLALAQYLISA